MAQYLPLVIQTGQIRQVAKGASDTMYGGTTWYGSGNIVKCNPVYVMPDGTVAKAKADVLASSNISGLALGTFAVAGDLQSSGIVTATTGEWDTITGGSGGLTESVPYYLSAATAGALTTTAPSTAGQYVVLVGYAVSSTELQLAIQQPIEIGGGNLYTPSGQKNVLINGNFQFWQRGTTVALADSTFLADRWKLVMTSAATGTMERSTDVPTTGTFCPYSLFINLSGADGTIAATDQFSIRQIIEGVTWARLKGKSYFTLSFWVKSTRTGVFSTYFIDSSVAWSYVNEHTINSANTWEKKTAIIPYPASGTWPETNALAAYFGITLAAGANLLGAAGSWNNAVDIAGNNQANFLDNSATDFRIAQVQIEPGSTVSPFELRGYQVEFDECQRFYWKTFAIDTAPVQNVNTDSGTLGVQAPYANAYCIMPCQYPVRMRASPTFTSYNPFAANTSWRDINNAADIAFVADKINDWCARIYGGPVANAGYIVIHLAVTAEF